MRVAVAAAFLGLSACATNGLSLAPPADVNFSGHWELNVADSDDPQHLLQTANQQAAAATNPNGGGGGGRSGRGGGRGQPGGPYTAPFMPPPPPVATLNEAFQWPNNKVDIKQVAGVVAFTAGASNRICTPSNADKKPHHHSDDEHRPSGRESPQLSCGWSDRTLIVQGGDGEDRAPYESSFTVSEDGKRLVEMVTFKGGRSGGYTFSRVWDRTP